MSSLAELHVRRKAAGGIDGIVGRRLRLNDERLRRGRRAARVVLLPQPRGAGLRPPGLHARGPWRRARATARTTSSSAAAGAGRRRSRAPRRGSMLRTPATIERAGPLKDRRSSTPATSRRSCPSRPTSFATCARRSSCSGAASLFVLLIAAVNITNLSLVRASGRMKELATRTRARRGAPPRRAAAHHRDHAPHAGGRLLGLGARLLGARGDRVLGFYRPPRAHGIRFDGVVLPSRLVSPCCSGIVVGAVPALQLAGRT